MTVYDLKELLFEYRNEDLAYLALRGLNLRIEKGEFVSIIGASGSGKSTLLNVLGLLATPTGGQFSVFEKDIHDLSTDEKAELRNTHIGFVFQHFALLPRLTVEENIALPLSFCDDKKRKGLALTQKSRVAELLKTVGMEGLEARYPEELSGGQKQRVAICRALFMDPQIILADEPTGALDSQTSQAVLDLLETIHKDGKTVVVITHDDAVAKRASRCVEIRDGLIQKDTLTHPQPTRQTQRTEVSKPPPRLSTLSKVTIALSAYASAIRRAYRNLLAYKMRSVLTGLGLFIGVLSIAIIGGLGDLVQTSFSKLFYSRGANKVYIFWGGRNSHGSHSGGYWKGFSSGSDFNTFAAHFDKYATIRPFLNTDSCTILSASKPNRARINGLADSEEFSEIDADLEVGRLPSPVEIANGAPVVVLGSGVPEVLFAKDYEGRSHKDFPVGEKIYVSGCNLLRGFTIVGVFKQQDTTFGRRDSNDVLYAPMSSMLKGMGTVHYHFFSALPKDGVDSRWIADSITNYLRLSTHDAFEFSSWVPAEIIEKIRTMINVIQWLTAFIGGLCVLVGGIGIMNIMMVIVTERVREIGIMKSLGARPNHIRNQFLMESITLCVLAGLAGVCCGIVANNVASVTLASLFPKIGTYRFILAASSLVIGLAVSFLAGLGFGYIPALRAGKLDPVQCLQTE